jgi:hypothetical protein
MSAPTSTPVLPPVNLLNALAQIVQRRYCGDLDELCDMASHAYHFLAALSHIADHPERHVDLMKILFDPTQCHPDIIFEAGWGTSAL